MLTHTQRQSHTHGHPHKYTRMPANIAHRLADPLAGHRERILALATGKQKKKNVKKKKERRKKKEKD